MISNLLWLPFLMNTASLWNYTTKHLWLCKVWPIILFILYCIYYTVIFSDFPLSGIFPSVEFKRLHDNFTFKFFLCYECQQFNVTTQLSILAYYLYSWPLYYWVPLQFFVPSFSINLLQWHSFIMYTFWGVWAGINTSVEILIFFKSSLIHLKTVLQLQ